jgi:hypothetical protein
VSSFDLNQMLQWTAMGMRDRTVAASRHVRGAAAVCQARVMFPGAGTARIVVPIRLRKTSFARA